MNVEPLSDLLIRTPRLELRLGSRDELTALGELARRGIHAPAEMPFAVPWTDRTGEPSFVKDFVEFHEASLRAWDPASWSLNFLVFLAGRPVGSQSLRAEDFGAHRVVDSGSWLGARYQGQGLGTEMRAAVLELAFRELGALEAKSGSFVGNEASKRVSEKLGYTVVGTTTLAPRGEPVSQYQLRIARREWRSPVRVELEGVEACLSLFGVI